MSPQQYWLWTSWCVCVYVFLLVVLIGERII